MNVLEAVAKWYGCPYGLQNCLGNRDRPEPCDNYMFVDPRPESSKGSGPGTTGQRTLCSLLEDLDEQIRSKP